MKKNAIITINDTTARVTKAFEKKARIFGTEEYETWKAYRQDFPKAQMVTKTIKKNNNKRTYRNLTYVNMELFISVNNPQLLDKFEKEKKSAKAQENPYRAVLAWFLKAFPNYDDYKQFFEDMDKDKTADAPVERSSAAEIEAPVESVEFAKAS